MSESQKQWQSSGAKGCYNCFFGPIKEFKSSPCWNCKRNLGNGLEGAYDPDCWVTDSDQFWKDEPKIDQTKKEEPKMTESYQKDALRETKPWPFPETTKENPLDAQVGGGHYKTLEIQPVEYIHANKIPFIEGNIIKYITRWREKGGKADLQKVKHFVDLLIELEFKDAEPDA